MEKKPTTYQQNSLSHTPPHPHTQIIKYKYNVFKHTDPCSTSTYHINEQIFLVSSLTTNWTRR